MMNWNEMDRMTLEKLSLLLPKLIWNQAFFLLKSNKVIGHMVLDVLIEKLAFV